MRSLFLFFVLGFFVQVVNAQDFLRFSGVVIDQEQVTPVDGTYIYNQSRGKESVSDSLGFFSIEAFVGDTLIFHDVRYEASMFVVPPVLNEPDYGIIQLLKPNTLVLDEVKIFPFPTQEEFTQAFLKFQPTPDLQSRSREVTRDLMKTVRESYDDDRYYYEMWADRRIYQLTGKIQPNHLIDPFRWTEFIRNLAED